MERVTVYLGSKITGDSGYSRVQSLNGVQLFATPWPSARQASQSITNSWSLLKLISIESVMPFNHLILCCPLLLPSIFPSIRVISNESFFTSGGKVLDVELQHQFSSFQICRSVVSDSATPWIAAHQASLSITNSWSLPKLMSIKLVMPSNHLILKCCSLLLLPSIFPSIRVFSNESALHIRWPKYWSFSFNISPSSEHSGLISFWMDCLDLLAVQGTLKSLLWHHSSKASILIHSAFFTVQLSHPYMTTGKTIALTRQTLIAP